ncbi:hypothetical protein Q8A67_000004 [Cirrhinus molitorella]|uniref:Uncharacterized protein n=1 Tax=Cirrhinus molitorella TaxID=172907 RepID=A0AA88T5K4_9TELE|nr:hypothetical protein Q8A67_000004 [Cirrhinus molitorella]
MRNISTTKAKYSRDTRNGMEALMYLHHFVSGFPTLSPLCPHPAHASPTAPVPSPQCADTSPTAPVPSPQRADTSPTAHAHQPTLPPLCPHPAHSVPTLPPLRPHPAHSVPTLPPLRTHTNPRFPRCACTQPTACPHFPHCARTQPTLNQKMAAAQKHVLRVYVARDTALKLTLLERPKSVEELKEIIHYEDPDFDGDLCLLVDILELPEKGTLRVVRPEGDTSSTESSDTDILPHALQRQKSWPDHFVVPGFGYEMEHILEGGNRIYEESGKLLKLKRSHKSEILRKMAEMIYGFKPYPHDKELAMAAKALITTHPCLRMTSGEDGELGWKRHIGYKVASYRNNLARAGVAEVAINTGKRSRNNPDSGHPHQNIKKARKAEVNYIINLAKLMRIYDLQEERDVNMRWALVLRALPVYLREDSSKFFRTCNSADGPDLTDTPVALLTVVTDDTTDASLFSPESICIVVEDEILVSGPTNLADSFLLLFGYIYALDLQYPKNLELTFTFIQKFVVCLEDNKPLKGRLLTLKNDLFN